VEADLPVIRRGGLISIITPAYSESNCIDQLARRLTAMFATELGYEWECVVVENGSADDTWQKLQPIHAADPRFKIVRLARNFRMDGRLTTELEFISSD
jgi:dolichol-phosphate mannosyltransferase